MSNKNDITSATRESVARAKPKNPSSLESQRGEHASSSSTKVQTNNTIDLNKVPTVQTKTSSFKTILCRLLKSFWLFGIIIILVILTVVGITLGITLGKPNQATVTNTTVATTTSTTAATTTTPCFYGEDEVRLVNGDIKTISELRSGMKVYSMDNSNKLIEDEIIMMLHRDPNETEIFCVIETIDPKYKLSVTCDHYVPVSQHSQTEYLISDDVKPDKHFVYVQDHETHELKLIQVKNVLRQYKTGLYGLTTNEGTLVVNNIVASCYSNFTTIRIAHNVLGLFRLYYKLAKFFSIEEPFQISTNGIPKPIKSLMDNKNLVIFFHDFIANIGWVIPIEVAIIIGYIIQIILRKIST